MGISAIALLRLRDAHLLEHLNDPFLGAGQRSGSCAASAASPDLLAHASPPDSGWSWVPERSWRCCCRRSPASAQVWRRTISSPSKRMRPPLMRVFTPSRPIMDMAVMLLPQPLSPTRPTTVCLGISRLTRSTGRRGFSPLPMEICRSSMRNNSCCCSMLPTALLLC